MDNFIHVIGNKGNVKVKTSKVKYGSITLNDVYLVLGLTKNLIFVSQIYNFGNYALFGPNDVKVLKSLHGLGVNIIFQQEKVQSIR